MLAADPLDLLGRETLVHRAVTLPENDAGVADGFRSVSSKFLIGVPNDHLLKRDAHAIAGIAAEMLVRKEENFFAALKGPFHDFGGVCTGADRATVLTGKSLNGRGR